MDPDQLLRSLPPCPLCGSRPALRHVYPPIPIRTNDWAIHCSEHCGEDHTFAAYGETPELAAEEWRSYVADELDCEMSEVTGA